MNENRQIDGFIFDGPRNRRTGNKQLHPKFQILRLLLQPLLLFSSVFSPMKLVSPMDLLRGIFNSALSIYHGAYLTI